jgi:hypothetical protein
VSYFKTKLKVRINFYKISLLFNIFPSYSVSLWFSNIFVQPRFFSFPFLVEAFTKFRLNKWNLFLIINIFITIFTPLIGLFFGRHLYYLDIAYVISSVYAFAFVNLTLKNQDNLNSFNTFIHIILGLNICYIVLQLILFYSGFRDYTMLHSNIRGGIPMTTGYLFGLPRYSGLFVENGPLTFFLCLSFLYLIQKGVNFPKFLKILVFILIVFSQSKFLLLFIPVLLLEKIAKSFFPRLYRLFVNPFFYLGVVSVIAVVFFLTIFNDYKFSQYLSSTIPAFHERLSGIRASLNAIWSVEIFGKGLLPTNFILKGASYKLLGLDVFSVVFFGYGLLMGTAMLLTYILIPILAKIDYKFTFCAILFLGFLSSGSLIVPQYLFALTYAIAAHYQNSNYKFQKT